MEKHGGKKEKGKENLAQSVESNLDFPRNLKDS